MGNKLGIVQANCPAYKDRPDHSDRAAPPSVAEWRAIPRARPSSGGNGTGSEELDDPLPDAYFEEEGFFSRHVRTTAFVGGMLVVFGLGCYGVRRLKRLDEKDFKNPHAKLGQDEDGGRTPNIVGEARSPTFAIGEGDFDDDEEAFNLVQNVDAAMNPLGSPAHASGQQGRSPRPQQDVAFPGGA